MHCRRVQGGRPACRAGALCAEGGCVCVGRALHGPPCYPQNLLGSWDASGGAGRRKNIEGAAHEDSSVVFACWRIVTTWRLKRVVKGSFLVGWVEIDGQDNRDQRQGFQHFTPACVHECTQLPVRVMARGVCACIFCGAGWASTAAWGLRPSTSVVHTCMTGCNAHDDFHRYSCCDDDASLRPSFHPNKASTAVFQPAELPLLLAELGHKFGGLHRPCAFWSAAGFLGTGAIAAAY